MRFDHFARAALLSIAALAAPMVASAQMSQPRSEQQSVGQGPQTQGPQTNTEATTTTASEEDLLPAVTERHRVDVAPAVAPVACQNANPAVCRAFDEAQIAQYQRVAGLNAMSVRQYDAQLKFSWIILLVVMAMVVAGLAFSAAQLWVVLKTGRAIETGSMDGTIAGKIVFRSSAMGLSVLAIAGVFFYLTLSIVYSIN